MPESCPLPTHPYPPPNQPNPIPPPFSTGMLLSHDPATGVTKALMDQLWFANGVAVSMDNSFVLVADSIQCRIWR